MNKIVANWAVAVTTMFASVGAVAADVVVGVANWPSITVSAEVIKNVLENNLGVEVELQPGTNPIIFEGMSADSMHVHPEVWLPNQAGLADKHADNVVQNMNPRRYGTRYVLKSRSTRRRCFTY